MFGAIILLKRVQRVKLYRRKRNAIFSRPRVNPKRDLNDVEIFHIISRNILNTRNPSKGIFTEQTAIRARYVAGA